MPVSNTPQLKKDFVEGKKKDKKPRAVLLKIPESMLEKIDKKLGQGMVKTPRTTWILRAIEKALEA